jgi:hypothetical protein
MPRARQLLCITYGTIALLALIATWSQNLSYFRPQEGWLSGFVMATGRFWNASWYLRRGTENSRHAVPIPGVSLFLS